MSVARKQILVAGSFDDVRSSHIRFLEEASRFGDLTILLWNDEALRALSNKTPKFTEAERLYLLRSIRFVNHVKLSGGPMDAQWESQLEAIQPAMWVSLSDQEEAILADVCMKLGVEHRVLHEEALRGFPELPASPSTPGRKKVMVTGCYDWLHSGHVRFFEEVSAYGDLYVVVGNDANVRMLKGPRNPMHSQDERRYVAGSIGFVKQALISTGQGWLDAEPELLQIKPDIYAVNEDGDKGGKGEFCQKHGIEYLVLKRTPAPGLPRRSSTDLRGY